MKVLLDTNVLYAAFASTGFCHELVETISKHHEMVSSPQLLKELKVSSNGISEKNIPHNLHF